MSETEEEEASPSESESGGALPRAALLPLGGLAGGLGRGAAWLPERSATRPARQCAALPPCVCVRAESGSERSLNTEEEEEAKFKSGESQG